MAPSPISACRGDGGGFTLAIGWPGQWSAQFTGVADGVAVQAGQQLTHLRLQPGERIRTPRMTVMAWIGEPSRAVNLWRRWYRAHVTPAPGRPPAAAAAGGIRHRRGGRIHRRDRGEPAPLPGQVRAARFRLRCLVDRCRLVSVHEMQQGERRWWLTGTWLPDPERFPHGLRPIAENAARHGARLLLWFEPERVTRGSALFREHPEWLLQVKDPEARAADLNALLNLGNPACRHWLTEHVCALIQQHGIGIYRQDFNFPPLDYWRENEAEDRQGMHENLHVQGYLQYWDDLLARNPGLWIDSCASGGRRNDLETMRRAVPLHYTDYGYGEHPVKLAFHQTMYAWLPYFKETSTSWDLPASEANFAATGGVDRFAFHTGMGPMFAPALDIQRDDYDYAQLLELIALWRRAAELLVEGDYFPLTPFSKSGARWVAWQFDRPEVGDGFLQAFRHAACAEETMTVVLLALAPESEYLFENPESGERRTLSGAVLLRDGFTLALPARGAALWFYRRL